MKKAKLYFESGETEKAKTAALEILNSPVKIESSATREIMKNTLTRNPSKKDSSVTFHGVHPVEIVYSHGKLKIRNPQHETHKLIGKKKRKPTSSYAIASSSDSLSKKKGGNVIQR